MRCKRCGKVSYVTKVKALGAASYHVTFSGHDVRAYRDARCDGWHLTTKPLDAHKRRMYNL